MTTLAAPALIAICSFHVAFGKLGAPRGVKKLQHEPADSFKVMKNFPFAVAIQEQQRTSSTSQPQDLTPKEGRFHYTDYKGCVIEELEYHGHQCILWARREFKDSLPQECIDQFVDTCGVVVPKHSTVQCDDSEEYR
ncbi:hypothetical protein V5799_004068 [Amblyomma americanum]|uniref:Secreted protein n=1 Tax=Amblyomma americanum TaxID=6943 RepID=A0AAQ4D759_AMBAM